MAGIGRDRGGWQGQQGSRHACRYFFFLNFFSLFTNSYLEVLHIWQCRHYLHLFHPSPPTTTTPPANHQWAAMTAVASKSLMDHNIHGKDPLNALCLTFLFIFCKPTNICLSFRTHFIAIKTSYGSPSTLPLPPDTHIELFFSEQVPALFLGRNPHSTSHSACFAFGLQPP